MVTSLSQLWSFSHSQCDSILQTRAIEIVNAYNPNKVGWERDSVYFGFFWITGWLAGCAVMLVASWRNKTQTYKWGRIVLPCFLLLGLMILYLQLQAMAQYVEVCRRLLMTRLTVPTHNEIDFPWLFPLIMVVFAVAWFSIGVFRWRTDSNPLARIVVVLLMIFGAAFFGYVGGRAVLGLLH